MPPIGIRGSVINLISDMKILFTGADNEPSNNVPNVFWRSKLRSTIFLIWLTSFARMQQTITFE